MGEGDIAASSNFMNEILSGDPTKVSQVLAPQISALKTSTQQDQKTRSMNGDRSGGTAAANAASTDKVHSDIANLVAQLTGSSASSLGSMGTSLLGAGMAGDQAAFGEASTLQKQKEAQLNDIFKSAASVAAAPFTGGASLTNLAPGGATTPSGGFRNPFGGGSLPGGMDSTDFSNLLADGTIANVGAGGGNAGLDLSFLGG
jgi:hypothetical protein